MYADLDEHIDAQEIDIGTLATLCARCVMMLAVIGGVAVGLLAAFLFDDAALVDGYFLWGLSGVALAALNFIIGMRVARSRLDWRYLAIPALLSAVFVIPIIEIMFS